MKKEFPMHAILTAKFMLIFADDWTEGVYALCSHLAGWSVFTHELPAILKHSPDEIRKQLPALDALPIPEKGQARSYYLEYCNDAIAQFSETLPIDDECVSFRAAMILGTQQMMDDLRSSGKLIEIDLDESEES